MVTACLLVFGVRLFLPFDWTDEKDSIDDRVEKERERAVREKLEQILVC